MNIATMLFLLFATPVLSSLPIALAWVYKRDGWVRKLPILSVFGLFVSLCITLYILFAFPEGVYTYPWLPEFNINFVFVFDYLSKYMGALTAFIAFLIGVYGLEYMKHDYRLGWYWFFFNMFTASMLLVVYSDNLLMLLIGWEGLGIASWGLIGHWFKDDDELAYVGVMGRKVGALKMFWSPSFGGWRAISTIRFGDIPMFFAIASIYALTGYYFGTPTLNISEIPWDDLFHKLGTAGTVILLIALLMGPFTKSAQLPFSEWLMTAMTGPTTVSALLHSATMVAAGTYLFMRLSWYIEPWQIHSHGLELVYSFVLFLGLISSLYGALVALGCRERKVLLASSTMSSLGLMFACSSASLWVGKISLYVAFWYLITHAFAKATLFLVTGHLIHATYDRFCCGNLKLARNMKLAFGATILATLCLSGIPPFTAYWVKSAMDEVMHNLAHDLGETPLLMLIAISVIYSAFLAKFLSLNFIKGDKPKILHLHGERLMPIAYAIMVSMLAVLLYMMLNHAEPIASKFVEKGFETTSLVVGLAVLVSYAIALVVPKLESPLGRFLGDRMYMPALNDLIVPKIGWVMITAVDYGNRAIDHLCHEAIPKFMEVCSLKVRAIQTGSLKRYVKIALGFVMVMLIVSSLIGW